MFGGGKGLLSSVRVMFASKPIRTQMMDLYVDLAWLVLFLSFWMAFLGGASLKGLYKILHCFVFGVRYQGYFALGS